MLKRILAISLAILVALGPTALPVYATVRYVDPAAGNNSNDGLTELTPWLTELHIEDGTVVSGDDVLFNAGTTLTITNTIVVPAADVDFSRYGDGADPIIDGRGALSGALTAGNWTAHSTIANTWRKNTATVEPKRLYLDGSVPKEANTETGTLGISAEFPVFYGTCDGVANSLCVRTASGSNPATEYTTITAFLAEYIFRVQNKDGVDFDNLHLRGGESGAMRIEGGDNWTISELEIDEANKGIILATGSTEGTTTNWEIYNYSFDSDYVQTDGYDDMGHCNNGIDLQDDVTDGVIRNSTFHNACHEAIGGTADNDALAGFHRITIHDITVTNTTFSGRGFGIIGKPTLIDTIEAYNFTFSGLHDANKIHGDGIHAYNGLLYDGHNVDYKTSPTNNTGQAWQYDKVGTNFGNINSLVENLTVYNYEPPCFRVHEESGAGVIENNTFRNIVAVDCGVSPFGASKFTDVALNVEVGAHVGVHNFEDSLFWNSSGTTLVRIGNNSSGTNYSIAAFLALDGTLTPDHNIENLISDDPDFADAGSDNYRLTASSPAIDTGDVSDSATDLDGNTRPSGSGYDMGAFEYQSGSGSIQITGATSMLGVTIG